MSNKITTSSRLLNGAGWLVFALAMIVYYFSAERTGSLWDCGEFILGAYKLQVVHPPGAPLFLLIGRVFALFGEMFGGGANIAWAVNMMSSVCTAFVATFVCWITMRLGRPVLLDEDEEATSGHEMVLAGAGIAAGLATAFSTSIWFSAVEGEVYAMSTFFTAMTLWAMVKWYTLPDVKETDRWLVFTVFSSGLSIGVHLLSILTFPALAMFYYYKKYKNPNYLGAILAAAVGVVIIGVIQGLIILGIPKLWAALEVFTVNGLGLPFHSGLIPTILVVGGVIVGGLYYAHKNRSAAMQYAFLGGGLVVIAFSLIGVVMIRANVQPPVNMNAPTDVMRLIPYLNREQYGERALIRGPQFDAERASVKTEPRLGQLDGRYEEVDIKGSPEYHNRDKVLFPRMSDATQGRPRLYKMWMGLNPDEPLPRGRPNMVDNIKFLFQYQVGWMYWRYFMWNFAGRQNAVQGYYPWDISNGHWISGISFLDSPRVGPQSNLPDSRKNDKARNTYFLIPFLLGLVGLIFHFLRRKEEAFALLAMFIITGIGIIIYSNQPPNEPRERDYVLVGSFFTYCIWIGFAALAIFNMLRKNFKIEGMAGAGIASVIVLLAPFLMLTQNFDDHSRIHHTGARDYASNFLESVEEQAIIFTYGDNDTYPLWYAQEVEGIRPDVRVINLSLIAVDWYIDLARRKMNESEPVKFTLPAEAYRGKKRNQIPFFPGGSASADAPTSIQNFLAGLAQDKTIPDPRYRNVFETYYTTQNVYIPVDRQKAMQNGLINPRDTMAVTQIPVRISGNYLGKDDLAILDIIGSNFNERPIYFAVTARPERLMGMEDYFRNEGLAIQLTPVRGQSDMGPYGLVGAGTSDADRVLASAKKWKWGNFDKMDLFVNNSYMPSVQSMQLSLRRAGLEFAARRENEKAIEIADIYFTAFPDMNFPYDIQTWYMLNVYLQAGAYDKAKPHIKTLIEETAQRMDYLMELEPDTRDVSYRREFLGSIQLLQELKQLAQRQGDSELEQLLKNSFGSYYDQRPEDLLN